MLLKEYIADRDEKLSRFLGRVFPELSYKSLMSVLRKKDVKIDGKRVSDDVTLTAGQAVALYVEEAKLFSFSPKIVYEDDLLVIVNKPRGMASEEYAERMQKLYPVDTLELAHRLDTNTEGLLIISKTESTTAALVEGFKKGYIKKTYVAMCAGKMTAGVQKAYLSKDAEKGIVKISEKKHMGSEEIITEIVPLEYIGKNTLTEVILHTGKTHQIRAHLAFLKHPIIGDPKYGDYEVNRISGANSQRLSACKLEFNFPAKSKLNYLNNTKVEISADFCTI